jgi:hypothetical protein
MVVLIAGTPSDVVSRLTEVLATGADLIPTEESYAIFATVVYAAF